MATTSAVNEGREKTPILDEDRTFHSESQKRDWRCSLYLGLIYILSFAVVVLIGGMVYVGSTSKYIPYVVMMKEDGSFLYGGEIKTLETIPADTLHTAVEGFVQKLRLVTPDTVLQAEAIRDVYSMVSKEDAAYVFLDEWYKDKEKNPFERVPYETVYAEMKSTLPISPSTLQVDWVDNYRTRAGALVKTEHMRALVTVYIGPLPKKAEEAKRNPNRIFVESISWSKVM